MKQLILTFAFLFSTGMGIASDLTAVVTHASSASGNGSVDLTVGGGIAPFTYKWTGPGGFTAITEDINGLKVGTYTVTVTDNYCGTATLTVQVDINTGFNAQAEDAFFSVYPNPVNTGAVTVVSAKPIKDASFRLMNMRGQVVMEGQNLQGSTFSIDVSCQPRGIYFMEIDDRTSISRIKLIRE